MSNEYKDWVAQNAHDAEFYYKKCKELEAENKRLKYENMDLKARVSTLEISLGARKQAFASNSNNVTVSDSGCAPEPRNCAVKPLNRT